MKGAATSPDASIEESANLFDATYCELGEGALWHPERNALFWFDILGQRLLMRSKSQFRQWLFDEIVSAAGWVDDATLFVAGETGLWRFDVETGARARIAALEADDPATRSNDGRADPWGGFWIGTMGKAAEPGAGAVYRYYRGTVTKLFADITIPNAIAFAPDGRFATFADTVTRQVMRVALDPSDGMPCTLPELFLDLTADGLNPDGAVFDVDGGFWLAQWGVGRVACYAPDGALQRTVRVPTPHSSCPAFGGEDGTTLFITTAREHLSPDAIGWKRAGQTFCAPVEAVGQREHCVTIA